PGFFRSEQQHSDPSGTGPPSYRAPPNLNRSCSGCVGNAALFVREAPEADIRAQLSDGLEVLSHQLVISFVWDNGIDPDCAISLRLDVALFNQVLVLVAEGGNFRCDEVGKWQVSRHALCPLVSGDA